MKNMVTLILMLLSLNIFSKEEILAIVSNDENKDIYHFIALTDDRTGDIKGFIKDNYTNNVKVNRAILNANNLKTENGVVLEQRTKYKVISLNSHNFDPVRGGTITIDTLLNGVTGERKTYELELARDKLGFKLFKSKRTITKFHIEINKKAIIGTVGVKSIRME